MGVAVRGSPNRTVRGAADTTRLVPRSQTPVKKAFGVSEHLAIPLTADAASPAAARAHVRRFLSEDHDDRQAAMAALITSELVTNAVVHGAAPIMLTLRVEDRVVRIEVCDADPRIDRVVPQPPDDDPISARGLHIVLSLAPHWGVRPAAYGKIVWAELPIGPSLQPHG